jgi:hypothetical protein
MIDWLRDPMWQFVGVVITFIFSWLALFLHALERRKKSLAYEIVLNMPIDDEVQVSLRGKPAKDIQLVVIKLINNGNVPIKSSDFESPINFCFGQNSRIIHAGIQEAKPPTLKPISKIKPGCVIINPTLVNANETILLEVLVSNYSGPIDCTARIVGISEIKMLIKTTAKLIYYEVFLLYIGLTLVAPAIIGLITKLMTPDIALILIAPGSLFMLAGETIIVVGFVLRLVHQKSRKRQAVQFIADK